MGEILEDFYRIQLDAIRLYQRYCLKHDMFEELKFAQGIETILGEEYANYRLRDKDSEARSVIREVYKVLGYNPNNPKQLH